jgi:alpha-glucosidase
LGLEFGVITSEGWVLLNIARELANASMNVLLRLVLLSLGALPLASLAGSPLPPDAPAADPAAMVVSGNARFTVLTPELIRMEWAADGRFEDRASLVFLNRRLPVPKFTHSFSEASRSLTIRTDKLLLTYSPTGDGRFTAGNLSIALKLKGRSGVWHPGLTDPDNLKGTTRTLDGARGAATIEPIEPGLISRSGWAWVDDSTRPLFDSADFRFLQGEESPWPWVEARAPGERQDWYFFGYGHNYRKALGDYVRVAGRIPLPPRYALGAWWSRYWTYTDREIEDLVHAFHENDTPLDVFVIDMDWHPTFDGNFDTLDASGNAKGWTGYSWNKLLFPDPVRFLEQLHADHLKVSLNLHPASGIQPWEDRYPEMAQAMGIDPASRQYVPFDITDKRFATNYMDLILHPLEKQGVEFWWLDWQQEQNTRVAGVNPTWWLNYVHFTDQQRQGKRPLLFHRWGGLGNHRYQIGFSGDTISVWDSLAFQPWFTATAANVGYAYWSHDIGGHMPGAVEPELYTRWVQFGAFSPILRTHAMKNPEAERRIWAYPEPYASVLRTTFQLRYALQPYLYTEARRTFDTGVAFVRPLYYEWPEEDAAYASNTEYLFGDEMLVAPVVGPADKATGLAHETLWLPPGKWIEEPTGKHFAGPMTIERRFSIDQIPVYTKAGSIVPMQPPMHFTGERPLDPLIVSVWPLNRESNSSYSLYEDSGDSVDYQRGAYTRTPIKASQDADALRIEIGPVVGAFPGMLMARGYELRLPGDWPPSGVTVNGEPLHRSQEEQTGWSFEGDTLTTVIRIPPKQVAERTVIEVRRATGRTAHRHELDGFAGSITRLREAFDAVRDAWPTYYMPPSALIEAMQAGSRMSYHPERASEEISSFRTLVQRAVLSVQELDKAFSKRDDQALADRSSDKELLSALWSQKQQRHDEVRRAEALLQDAQNLLGPETQSGLRQAGLD